MREYSKVNICHLVTLLNLKLLFVISFKVQNNSTLGEKTDDKPEGHDAPVEASFVFGQNMRDRAKV